MDHRLFNMALHSLIVAFLYPILIIAQSHRQIPLIPDSTGSENCDIVCISLAQKFQSNVHHRHLPPDFSSSFFSQQQGEVIPACVFFPTSSQDISQTLGILRTHSCPFAIKSGGHGIFAGSSNAHRGVTIDLSRLDSLQLSEDHSITSVGTGRKWGDVYQELEPLNLTVAGGRDTQIGVGGFILGDEYSLHFGGGISFVSRRYGWGFDNVKSFEVVLANGSIVNISYESHPDLYFAFRGAGNRFGVVTKFDLNTFSQGPVWGGHSFYLLDDVPRRKKSMNVRHKFDWTTGWFIQRASKWAIRVACHFRHCSSVSELLRHFGDFAESTDRAGQVILSFAFVPYNLNNWVACLSRLYGEPEANPSVFRGFASEDHKSFHSTNRITRLSSINAEVDWMNAVGYRQAWSTATFKMDVPFMSRLVNIYIKEIDAIKHVSGLLPSLIMQIITREEIARFQSNGGNAIGITDENGPLLLINSAIRWNNAKDDYKVNEAGNRIIDRALRLAKNMGVHHRFLYQNYANQTQDVFAGYGEENRRRLGDLQKVYDPEGVFERLQPGGFRL